MFNLGLGLIILQGTVGLGEGMRSKCHSSLQCKKKQQKNTDIEREKSVRREISNQWRGSSV